MINKLKSDCQPNRQPINQPVAHNCKGPTMIQSTSLKANKISEEEWEAKEEVTLDCETRGSRTNDEAGGLTREGITSSSYCNKQTVDSRRLEWASSAGQQTRGDKLNGDANFYAGKRKLSTSVGSNCELPFDNNGNFLASWLAIIKRELNVTEGSANLYPSVDTRSHWSSEQHPSAISRSIIPYQYSPLADRSIESARLAAQLEASETLEVNMSHQQYQLARQRADLSLPTRKASTGSTGSSSTCSSRRSSCNYQVQPMASHAQRLAVKRQRKQLTRGRPRQPARLQRSPGVGYREHSEEEPRERLWLRQTMSLDDDDQYEDCGSSSVISESLSSQDNPFQFASTGYSFADDSLWPGLRGAGQERIKDGEMGELIASGQYDAGGGTTGPGGLEMFRRMASLVRNLLLVSPINKEAR